MMTLEDSPRQVVELPLAGLTQVPLTMFLPLVMTELNNVLVATKRAAHALRPAQLSNHFEALGLTEVRAWMLTALGTVDRLRRMPLPPGCFFP